MIICRRGESPPSSSCLWHLSDPNVNRCRWWSGTSKYCPAVKGKAASFFSSGPQHSDRKEFLTKTPFFRRGFRWRAMSLLLDTRRFTLKLKQHGEKVSNTAKKTQKSKILQSWPTLVGQVSSGVVYLRAFWWISPLMVMLRPTLSPFSSSALKGILCRRTETYSPSTDHYFKFRLLGLSSCSSFLNM